MCDPVSMAVAMVVTTAASVVSEVQAAKNQEKAIKAQFAAQQQEITQQQTAELNDRAREARAEQARIKVAAGEAGLQLGGSVETLLMDSVMQHGLSNERINLNTEHKRNASASEANSMLSRIQKPTVFGAALRIASAGVQGYASGSSMQASQTAASAGPKG